VIRHLLIVALVLATAVAVQAAEETVVRGLDHVPLAVKDLERSMADFRALGFSLKPGRPHENGLRNAHVKFPDGTEIELITAPAALDALTTEYFNWLKAGDGPAFLGIYAPDFSALIKRLSTFGLALNTKGGLGTFAEPATLRRLFFASRQHSPTDREEHFAHTNTAYSLARVWLAGAEAEQHVLQVLGAESIAESRCGPFGSSSAVLSMVGGEVVFLPVSTQLSPGRSIVGVSVTVKSLDTVRRTLTGNRIPLSRQADCDHNSLWVGPPNAHGMWLEFREQASR
jgi:hypothetical protein